MRHIVLAGAIALSACTIPSPHDRAASASPYTQSAPVGAPQLGTNSSDMPPWATVLLFVVF